MEAFFASIQVIFKKIVSIFIQKTLRYLTLGPPNSSKGSKFIICPLWTVTTLSGHEFLNSKVVAGKAGGTVYLVVFSCQTYKINTFFGKMQIIL